MVARCSFSVALALLLSFKIDSSGGVDGDGTCVVLCTLGGGCSFPYVDSWVHDP